jgi:RNA polymerase sigma-70 factor (ECF subfamily)
MTQEEKEKTSGFEAARARLTSIAYRMLGSRAEAEDVVQDAWLKWHAAAAAELRTPLAWLTTVTTRLAIDRIRRVQSEQAARTGERLMQPWLDELAPSAEDEVLHTASVADAVALLFDRLSPDERVAFVLREAFDYDYAQIAKVVGKTAAHCRQLAHRARQRLASGADTVPNRKACERVDAGGLRARNIERLRAAIHGADASGAMQLLADGAIADAVAAAAATAADRPSAAGAALRFMAAASADGTIEAHALPTDWGAAFAFVRACEVVGLVRLSFDDEGPAGSHVVFTLTTSGAQVDELNRRFGARAISQLLERIAGRPAMTEECIM